VIDYLRNPIGGEERKLSWSNMATAFGFAGEALEPDLFQDSLGLDVSAGQQPT